MTDQHLTDLETEIIDNVRNFGCQVMSVFDPDAVEADFSYSVGFWETVNQPEVIVLGLSSKMGMFAVTETLRQCRAGLQLSDWQPIEGLFEEFDVTCVARAIDESHLTSGYFNSASWYHSYRTGRPLAEAMQLVWSYDNFYPWDEGAPAALLEDQPLLYSGAIH